MIASPLVGAAGVFLFALALRLAFLRESLDIPVIRTPTPGLDIDVYWNAARQWRLGEPGAPNFEFMICSAPLHVMVLAALQSLLGESMTLARVAVATVASARMALFFSLFRRLPCPGWAAWLASLALCAIPSLVYFDTVLIKAATDLNLLTLLLFLLLRPAARSARGLALQGALLGGVLSACFLSQLNTLLYAPVVASFLLVRPGATLRSRWCQVAPALGLLALTTAVFNAQLKGDLIPHSGVNLLLGFNPKADITYRSVTGVPAFPHGHAFLARLSAELELDRPLTPQQADRHYLAKAAEFVWAQPGRSARLILGRMAASVNDFEVKGGDDIYWLSEQSAVLGRSPVRYGMIFVLAALGVPVLWARGRRAEVLLLVGLVAAVAAAQGLSFVTFRFRLPMLLPLGLLAGVGVSALGPLLDEAQGGGSARARLRLAGAAALLAAAAWLTFRPIPALVVSEWMIEANADANNRVSLALERQQAKLAPLAADSGLEATGLARRALLYAGMQRHSEAYRDARAVTGATLASRSANLLSLRYLIWLGQYDAARRFDRAVHAGDPGFSRRILEDLHEYERGVYERFITAGAGGAAAGDAAVKGGHGP